MTARYTLIIGTQNWSSWSLRPYMALSATGQPFETIVLRLRRPETKEEILKYSSAGKVPVLKFIDNGRPQTVWDSLAICETIAERHPEAGLLPADAQARAMARSYAAEMHSGFPDVRDQLGMYFAGTRPMPELRPDTEQQLARIITAWEQALKSHGDMSSEDGGGFLFGRFSIADCMYAPVVSRFRTYNVALPPIVQAYADRVWALPAMQEWLKASEKEVADGIGEYPRTITP
jgi:glutathione S-transferase